MCLALPAKITTVDLDNSSAEVDIGGVIKKISVALVPDVQVNDYVLVHVGFALNRISEIEAQRTLALFAEAGLVEITKDEET